MELLLDPTYVMFDGPQLGPRSSTVLCCPVCGSNTLTISGIYRELETDAPIDIRSIAFTCLYSHNFAWKFRSGLMDIMALSVDVVVVPTQLAFRLADKWCYDPSKRFVNGGGYRPASAEQITKIRELGGSHPNEFHELYTLIQQYWGYRGFDGWSSNDAGFVIAWLTGKYGEFPEGTLDVPV